MRPGNKIASAMPQYDFGVTDSGNEYVQLTFVVREGPDAGEVIGWRGFFTEKTVQRTIESLRYCGWGGDDITDLAGVDRNLVQLVTENETYEGKTRLRVKWVNRLTGGVPAKNRMDDASRAVFAARMKGEVLSVPASYASEGTRYAPEAASAVASDQQRDDDPGFGDDDIPF